ncbi:ribonuclease H-like domain-containing protein [Tanacetum coccineum]|uniref:Ribonuclease H-like domain-containing protein n=1 Tax=Tanacetum coccineum TaxID=301880 RepID=A0ABQ5DRW1_9ASTR
MRQYICHTYHNLWDIIVNGDLEDEATPSGEQSSPPVPKTAKQLPARRNQERIKSILLLVIPDKYLLKFHNVPDAKSLWAAIKSRFRGNEESKKMQKNVLKHQFENFVIASNETLDKAYDRFQKLIRQLEIHGAYVSKEDINQKFLRSLPPSWSQIALIIRNKPDINEVDIDDLYKNLRVYEDELKRSSGSNSASQNFAFVSSQNTKNANEVSTASGDFGVNIAGGINQVPTTPSAHDIAYSFLAQPTTSPQLENKDFHQRLSATIVTENDILLENVNLEGVKEEDLMVTMAGAIELKINNLNLELKKAVKEIDELKLKIEKWEGSSKNLTKILNSQMITHDKNRLGFGTQMNDLSNKSETDSVNSLTIFEVRSSNKESTLENNRFTKANEYHVVPPPITGNPLTPRADISFARLDEYAFRNKIIESKTIETNKTVGTINEATITSNDEDDVCANETGSSVKPNVTQAVRSQADKSGQTSQKQGIVLTRAGLVNSDRSNVSTARSISTVRLVYIVRPVSTARPLASKIAQSNSVIRQKHPRLDIVRPKASNIPIKRSYFTQPIYRPKDLKPDVKTFGVNNMTTIGTRAVVSKGKVENVLKKDKWGNPEILLQDHAVVDSGCSSHMTGNKAYLSDYEDFNGSFVAFGSDPKGDELKFNLFSVSQMCDKKNSVLFTESECLIVSPSFKLLDESLEKQLNHNVKIVRCDNGTEFKKEFEAARTMLADSLLPIPFWAEAVNTACYVLNRVLVTKPQNKKPYELLIGKPPSISFMRPFGCPLTILNTLDSLGKFDGKSNEGYLLGYSTSSKAFRVYNKRTKRVEENLHINFPEDQPNVARTGPNWMFNLDFLTTSMNYTPVSVENQVIMDAGTQDSYVAGSSGKDKGPTQEYILLPLQPYRIRIPVEDVPLVAPEKPSESSPKENDVQDSEYAANKEK